MATPAAAPASPPRIQHSREFRARRFLNWFPLGLTYALLYMGRYNLTVAKTELSQKLMTKEDFGVIFFCGTLVYAVSFLVNGPLVDRIGGRKGILVATTGSMAANLAMGLYLRHLLESGAGTAAPLRLIFSALYAANMYFQSFGAVSILKVNVHWFHVSERGGFSGIFGTMISSGIFLAFTVNGWLLGLAAALWKDQPSQWVVFLAPALLLGVFTVVEALFLRDRPSQAGFADFDTGDASSGDTSEAPVPALELYRRLLSSPVLLTIAAIELCTGVVRQGVMQWFPIYAREVWALEKTHPLVDGSWSHGWLIAGCFAVAVASVALGVRSHGAPGARRWLISLGVLAFLVPFLQAGWGGLLFVAGVIGANAAGWVSDLFFQSRRGPAAAGLYLFLGVCTVAACFLLAVPTNRVAWADPASGLQAGDRILAVAGKETAGWADVRAAVTCWPAACQASGWDAKECVCSTELPAASTEVAVLRASPGLPARLERGGAVVEVELVDPKPRQRAGDQRLLKARPVLPLSPFALGVAVFLISICVIGTHGLLSGTATLDFGGRKAAATAGGMIDGFVYLGTALQALSLGVLTTKSWTYWPPFLIPFAFVGFALCLRIWNAKPKGSGSATSAPDRARGPAAAA